jgi:type I restriction enzyme, S subunit
LGALDDKIALNGKISATLEAISRDLFSSWFTDFDPVNAKVAGQKSFLPRDLANLFPAEFETGTKQIPDGWKAGIFSDVAGIQAITKNPLASPNTLFEHFSIPAFDDGRRAVIELGSSIKSNKFLVPDGAVLMSKLNPNTDRVWLVDPTGVGEAIASTEFIPLVARPPFTRSYVYCLARNAAYRQELCTLVTGTSNSHQRVRPEAALALAVLLPPQPVIKAFDDLVSPMLSRVLHALRESRALTALRDALLPKLISGEISVLTTQHILERSA